MRATFLALLVSTVCIACGDTTTSNPPVDASFDDQKTTSDGSTPDASIADASQPDGAKGDSSIPYEAGSLDQCNPNDPSSCGVGLKCCSEPTHKMPPSAYICAPPTTNGTCPMYP